MKNNSPTPAMSGSRTAHVTPLTTRAAVARNGRDGRSGVGLLIGSDGGAAGALIGSPHRGHFSSRPATAVGILNLAEPAGQVAVIVGTSSAAGISPTGRRHLTGRLNQRDRPCRPRHGHPRPS